MSKLQLNESIFSPLVSAKVSVEIVRHNVLVHKLGPITFLGVTKQKVTEMVNAPSKRLANGKAYTPVMFSLLFDGNASLVFVEEDTKILVKSDGLRLLLDNMYVDVVKYVHELQTN